jgi:hypothetical protein
MCQQMGEVRTHQFMFSFQLISAPVINSSVDVICLIILNLDLQVFYFLQRKVH